MENNIETNPMNQEILAGKWKQIRGELKTWWGKLTDDDVDTIGGQKDKLTGLLQEKYGYTREAGRARDRAAIPRVRRQDSGNPCQCLGQGTGARRNRSEEGN